MAYLCMIYITCHHTAVAAIYAKNDRSRLVCNWKFYIYSVLEETDKNMYIAIVAFMITAM